MPKYVLITSILLFIGVKGYTQSNRDSLLNEYKNTSLADTSRMKALDLLIKNVYLYTKTDTARLLADELHALATKTKDINFLAQAFHLQGHCAVILNEHLKAVELYKKSAEYRINTGNKKGLAISYANIASVLKTLGDNLKAREYAEKAINTYEEANDRAGLMKAFNAAGNIYLNLGRYVEALNHYQNALTIAEEENDLNMKGIILVNSGNVHYLRKDFDEAITSYKNGAVILEKTNDKRNRANAINNTGSVYLEKSLYDSSEIFFKQALALREEVKDEIGISETLNNLGALYIKTKDFVAAKKHVTRSLEISRKTGRLDGLPESLLALSVLAIEKKEFIPARRFVTEALAISRQSGNLANLVASYRVFYTIEKEAGNYKEALLWHEKVLAAGDSLLNEETKETLIKAQYKYEYNRKAIADSLKTEGEKKITLIQLKQEKTRRSALYGGLFLLLLFGLFMFNRFKVTQKQKKQIEMQKTEVENQKQIVDIKQKEILDSISYAKRLQDAILPPENFWHRYLPESFILYLPKDIVAGDFYWMHAALGNQKDGGNSGFVFFAVADCTGHGVPGAMVSVVCSNALNRTVQEFGITDPGKILDKVRELVIETFEKSDKDVKDGMDISLCCLQTLNNELITLKWAGANNPLWLIRDGDLVSFTSDKQPIGKYAEQKNFTTHTIKIQKNDLLYLFTDGYADQFGGEKGKKLKYKQLAAIIKENAGKEINSQKNVLEKTFSEWKNNLEQVDDVLIIGIKI